MSQETYCGGCCADIQIILDTAEASCLARAGTRLEPILPPPAENEPAWNSREGLKVIGKWAREARLCGDAQAVDRWFDAGITAQSMREGDGLFAMAGRCGNLSVDNTCSNYAARPAVCRSFEIGQSLCRVLQKAQLEALYADPSAIAVEITTKNRAG